jgi:AmpD protein
VSAVVGLDARAQWLVAAQRAPSPNCDLRPVGVGVDLVIVHGISLPPGQFGSGCVRQLFLNKLDWEAHGYFKDIKGLRVSSHVLIERDGALVQFVPFGLRAWHAGESRFRGRPRCNDYSVGIELEGCDDEAYEAVQYQRLCAVLRALMRGYPAITLERIVGHCHVAPGRKTDPGPSFSWTHLGKLLGAGSDWVPGRRVS